MPSVDDSFALVREARDLDELGVDDVRAAETDPENSDGVNIDSTLPRQEAPKPEREVEQAPKQLSIPAFFFVQAYGQHALKLKAQ